MKKYVLSLIIFIAFTSYCQAQKDSLFFHSDQEYLKESKYSPGLLYPDDFQTDEGGIFFRKKEIFYNLNPKEILCLKDYLHSLNLRKNRIYDLANHLWRFKLFLVKEENVKIRYIELNPEIKIY